MEILAAMEKSDKFEYTYSAGEQEEIKRIREKYKPKVGEETTIERLRRLDAGATKAATVVSVLIGIISTLVLGVGMCCTMVWAENMFVLGIIVGLVGIVGLTLAYPIYTHMVRRKREKLAPEILRLSDELMK